MADNFQELLERGVQERCDGHLAESRATFFKVVRSAAEAGDRISLASALCGLGQAEQDIGNLEPAQHHYAGAVVLYRQLGDAMRLAYALRHEADLLRLLSRPDQARPIYQEAEAIYRERGESAMLDLANTLSGLALTDEASSGFGPTESIWKEARALYAQCNDPAGVAECDEKLARS